jgi:hypothetical protein
MLEETSEVSLSCSCAAFNRPFLPRYARTCGQNLGGLNSYALSLLYRRPERQMERSNHSPRTLANAKPRAISQKIQPCRPPRKEGISRASLTMKAAKRTLMARRLPTRSSLARRVSISLSRRVHCKSPSSNWSMRRGKSVRSSPQSPPLFNRCLPQVWGETICQRNLRT